MGLASPICGIRLLPYLDPKKGAHLHIGVPLSCPVIPILIESYGEGPPDGISFGPLIPVIPEQARTYDYGIPAYAETTNTIPVFANFRGDSQLTFRRKHAAHVQCRIDLRLQSRLLKVTVDRRMREPQRWLAGSSPGFPPCWTTPADIRRSCCPGPSGQKLYAPTSTSVPAWPERR